MSENPRPPQHASDTAEVVRQQQDAIRSMTEARVQDTPLPGPRADSVLGDFGLEPGKYDVYGDSVVEFGGGFRKFVSKEDPSERLVGLAWREFGGATTNPSRYSCDVLLLPNGDIAGRITTENDRGITSEDLFRAASDTDPERKGAYETWLREFHKQARLKVEVPREEGQARPVAETRPPVASTRSKRWLGRFSLRP